MAIILRIHAFSRLILGRLSATNWGVAFFAVCFFLVFITGLNFHLPQFDSGIFQLEDREQGWRLLEPFNLARENNVAAWWSGACLLTAGMLSFQQANRTRSGPFGREFSFILAAILLALFCDEVGSIHERIGSMRNIAPFGILGIGVFAYAVWKAWGNVNSRNYLMLIVGGFCVFGSVAVQEVMEHAIDWPPWSVGLRFAVEEGTELLGMYLILRALIHADVAHREQTTLERSEHNAMSRRAIAWTNTLPQPSRFPGLWWLLLGGLTLHVIAAVGVLPAYDDLLTRGNTAACFPCMVYLLLAFGYRERIALDGRDRTRDWLFFACLIFCSLDSVAAFSQYAPKVASGISEVLPLRLFETTGCGRYALHMVLISTVAFSLSIKRPQKLCLLGLTGIGLVSCLAEPLSTQLVVPGGLTFGLAALLIPAFSLDSLRAASPITHRSYETVQTVLQTDASDC